MRSPLPPVAVAALLLCGGLLPLDAAVPSAEQNVVLTAPITTWDEAVPLGNGLMGGLLWGEQVTQLSTPLPRNASCSPRVSLRTPAQVPVGEGRVRGGT